MKLLTFSIMIFLVAACAGQTQSACNPEMPRYAEWSAAQHFPYLLSRQKQEARASSLSKLKLGLTKQQVQAVAGSPDYVADGALQPNAVACIWVYAFEDKAPSEDPKDKGLVVIGFTADGKLAALQPHKVNGILPMQVKDKSCEAGAETLGTLHTDDLAKGHPYEAVSQRQAQIRTAYPRLSLGMSIGKVVGLVGKPDLVSVQPHGHLGNVWIVGEPCQQQLVYVLRQSSNNPIDPNTVAIYFSFDEYGRLFWAAPQNVQGLKEIGSAVQ